MVEFVGSLSQHGTATDANSTTTEFSFSYTQRYSGSLVLVCVDASNSNGDPSAITFNGQSMVEISGATRTTAAGRVLSIWGLNVSSSLSDGTYTVSMTVPDTTASTTNYVAGQYAGGDFYNNAVTGNVAYSASPTSFSHSTVLNDSWVLLFARFTVLRTFNGSTDGVYRMTGSSAYCVVDSGASEGSAGSKTLDVTSSAAAGGSIDYIMIEIPRDTFISATISEAATASDGSTNAATRSVAESTTETDTVLRTLTRTQSESVTTVEALLSEVSRVFSEAVSTTEALFRSLTRRVTEALTASDGERRITLTRTFQEATTVAELVPQFLGIWIPRTPPSTSWTERTQPGTSFTARTPPNTSFSARTPPSTSWTNRTPPNTTWS